MGQWRVRKYSLSNFPDKSLVYSFQARPLLRPALDKDELDGLVDPRLERNYVQNEMHTMIRIAAACVRHSSARRPQMGDVI